MSLLTKKRTKNELELILFLDPDRFDLIQSIQYSVFGIQITHFFV